MKWFALGLCQQAAEQRRGGLRRSPLDSLGRHSLI